jgi:Co/Zn/Cd efflux system component
VNWYRIAAACTVPLVMAAPLVAFCWHRRHVMAGTIAGAGVCFVGFVFFAAWDFAEALNSPPPITAPSIFTKIAAYGFVAMAQVMVVFLVSQSIEKRISDRDRDGAWR